MAQTGSNSDILAGILGASQAAGNLGQQKANAAGQRERSRATALESLLSVGAAQRQQEQLALAKLTQQADDQARAANLKLGQDQLGFSRQSHVQNIRAQIADWATKIGLLPGDAGYEDFTQQASKFILEGGAPPTINGKPVPVQSPPNNAGLKFLGDAFANAVKGPQLPFVAMLARAGKRAILGSTMSDEQAQAFSKDPNYVPEKTSFLREVLGVPKGSGELPDKQQIDYTPSPGARGQRELEYLMKYQYKTEDLDDIKKAILTDAQLPSETRQKLYNAIGAAELQSLGQRLGMDGLMDIVLSRIEAQP